MKHEPHYLQERVRIATENLVTLLLLVICLGFVLAVIAGVIAGALLEGHFRWWWIGGFSVLSIFLVVGIVYGVYAKGHSVETYLTLVLPFHIEAESGNVVVMNPYPITLLAHRMFSKILSYPETKKQFLITWNEAIRKGLPPFQENVCQFTQDLLEYILLDTLRDYAEMTLSPKCIYTKHRWLPIKLESKRLNYEEWPVQLQDNICFRSPQSGVLEYLTLPEMVKLQAREFRTPGGTESREIALKSRFGTVSFSFSPYAQRISDRSREGRIARKYCDLPERTGIWIAKFLLKISINFGGISIFSKRFRQSLLPWSEDLVEFYIRQLDWDRCIERDLERMVIKIVGQGDRGVTESVKPIR